MERIIKHIITANIDDCKLYYTDNAEIETLKFELFNNGIDYEIDRNLIYDKLGEILEYADEYDMIHTVIMKLKQKKYSDLFSLYALSVFDQYAIEIIKDKYKYDRKFIRDRYNEIIKLTYNEIIKLYKADNIKDELIKFVTDWHKRHYTFSISNHTKELQWGMVQKIINGIDYIEY
tara:strand:- start:777 stop:1304 length:528 start_codon:yes stop_codon:yes gene_type:complete